MFLLSGKCLISIVTISQGNWKRVKENLEIPMVDMVNRHYFCSFIPQAQHEVHIEPLVQSVKAICTTLAKVETNSISQAIQKLEVNITKSAVEGLTKAVLEFIDSYCQAFDTDFNKLQNDRKPAKDGVKDITTRGQRLSVRLDSAHRLPRAWKTRYGNGSDRRQNE